MTMKEAILQILDAEGVPNVSRLAGIRAVVDADVESGPELAAIAEVYSRSRLYYQEQEKRKRRFSSVITAEL